MYIYTFCLSFHRLFYLPATCSSHLLMLPPPTNTKDIGIEMPTAGGGGVIHLVCHGKLQVQDLSSNVESPSQMFKGFIKMQTLSADNTVSVKVT